MRFLFVAILILFSAQAYSQPFIQFDTTNVNIGEICDGPKFDVYWKFTNISDTTVVIDNANSTGAMLVSEWSQEPIKPGKSATIHGVLQTAGWAGRSFYRTILVQLTNGSRNTISVKGDVKNCKDGVHPQRTQE
jgi:hypothetical protein